MNHMEVISMYTFEFLKEHELSNVIDIISQRIQWMDEKGICLFILQTIF